MRNETLRRFAMGALGASLMVSISGTYIIGVMVLAYIIVDRPAWKKSPLDIPLLIYVVWGMFTLLVREPTQIIEAIRAQFAVLFFFLTAHAMHEDDLKSMGKWFLIAAAITGAWGVVQVASHVVYHPTATTYDYPAFYNGWPRMVLHAIASRDGRGVGTRSHPLTYAECLAPALFVVLAAVLTKRESRGRGLVLLACVVAGLICAKGRAIWGGMLVGLLAVSAFIPKKQRLILLGSMVLVGAVVFGASSELRGRALSTFSSTAGIQGDQDSKNIRLLLWARGMESVKEHPFIGVGIKRVGISLADLGIYPERIWSEMHNMYVQSLVEEGLIGFGILIWILFLSLRLLLKNPTGWRMGFVGAFAAMLVAGFTESWIRDKEVGFIFWGLIGTSEFLRREEK
jgi:O-antigen ligase